MTSSLTDPPIDNEFAPPIFLLTQPCSGLQAVLQKNKVSVYELICLL